MSEIILKNISIKPEDLHRAIQIGLCRRIAREKCITIPDDFFECMPTADIEKWRETHE